MVTLLPASSEDEQKRQIKRHKLRLSLDAPISAKKVKVKASFKFPSKKAEGPSDVGRD